MTAEQKRFVWQAALILWVALSILTIALLPQFAGGDAPAVCGAP